MGSVPLELGNAPCLLLRSWKWLTGLQLLVKLALLIFETLEVLVICWAAVWGFGGKHR